MPASAPPLTIDRMSLNTISVRDAHIIAVIDAAAAAGIGGIGVWRHQVAEVGTQAIREQCEDQGLRITSLCRGGLFPADSQSERAERIDDTMRAVDEAAELGAGALVIVSGPVAGGSIDAARAMVRSGLEAILPRAADRGVTIGLEPLHPMFAADRSVVVTLAEANDLIEQLDSASLKLVVDIYHCWWDVGVYQQIGRAAGRIAGFHISDWVPVHGDALLSRAVPGDGCIEISRLRQAVEAAGFRGLIEVEVMNPDLWAQPLQEAIALLCKRFVAHG